MTLQRMAPSTGAPPEEYMRGMPIEHDGWIYHEISAMGLSRQTPIYSGTGFAATFMICSSSALVVSTHEQSLGSGATLFAGGCVTVTSDHINLSTPNPLPDTRVRLRYRIVAVHPAVN